MIAVNSERLDMLQQAFPSLNEREIRDLDSAAQVGHYPAGAVICRQGEWASVFYVLCAGDVTVTSVLGGGEWETVLHRASAPYYFGELALLGDGVRSATIRAATTCETLEIEKQTFRRLANNNPGLRQELFRQLSQRMQTNDRLIIDQLNRQNAALQAAYENLARQDRMRSEFITNLSHELRTPLTAIQGFTHLIKLGVVRGEALQEGVEAIARNVDKMTWLVNSLLVLYEMQLTAPRLSPTNLNDLLTAALNEALTSPEYADRVVSVALAPDLPSVFLDVAGVTLALRLLIVNALKFSPGRAPVLLRAFRPEAAWLTIEVIDEGVGIPVEMQGQIFEPFFHWSHSDDQRLFSGLGVGLSIADYIIHSHGGRIELESDPGRGSTFRVFLPAAAPAPLSQGPPSPPNPLTA